MKKYILTFILSALLISVQAQTIVKMDVPPQAKEPLKVVVLFDEQVPEGMPVVLGLMGYKVTGGIEPYTYEWIQNGKVVGTGDVVIITPIKGDKFELKATDKNRCFSINSFSMKVIARIKNDEGEKAGEYSIFPTLVKNNYFNVTLPKTDTPLQANIRIFDIKGAVRYRSMITGSSTIHCNLPDGIYFVSVLTDGFHKVEKIILQH